MAERTPSAEVRDSLESANMGGPITAAIFEGF